MWSRIAAILSLVRRLPVRVFGTANSVGDAIFGTEHVVFGDRHALDQASAAINEFVCASSGCFASARVFTHRSHTSVSMHTPTSPQTTVGLASSPKTSPWNTGFA
jgi:hypothetical protein